MGMSKTWGPEVDKWTFHQISEVTALINKSLQEVLTKTINPSSGVIEALFLRSIASLGEATRFISANTGNFFGTVSTLMGSLCAGLLGKVAREPQIAVKSGKRKEVWWAEAQFLQLSRAR